VLSRQKNGTGALASATAAGFGAGGKCSPLGHFTVDLLHCTLSSPSLAHRVTASITTAAFFGPQTSERLESVDGTLEAGTTRGLGHTNTLRAWCASKDGRTFSVRGPCGSSRFELLATAHGGSFAQAIRIDRGGYLFVMGSGTFCVRRTRSVRGCGRLG